MIGKSVAKKEIRAYIKARSKTGCCLKQIFAEIYVVYGAVNVSYDTVRWCKKKFDSGLESTEKKKNPEGQSVQLVAKLYQK